MQRLSIAIVCFGMTCSLSLAEAPVLPSAAKQLTGDEIVKLLDGKTRTGKVYSAKGEMTAITTWDWRKKIIAGTWKRPANGKSGKFSYVWSIDGDKSCGAPKGQKPSCSSLFMDGDTLYDIKEGATVNSVSMP
jgi:hypothetical protein